MIKLSLFNYSKYNSTDIKVTKYINENLKCMTRVMLDMIEDDCELDIEYYIPRNYLTSKSEECKKLIYELYDILSSNTLRDYVKPNFEYLLYAIISWWEDITSDEEELIPVEISEEMLNEIKGNTDYWDEDGCNLILERITNFEEFYYFCFEDHDFLPGTLESMVTIYLRSPDLFKSMFSDVDLNEYIDLMPVDLQELYNEKQSIHSTSQNHLKENYNIVKEFCTCLDSLEQRIVEIEKRDEVEISNDLYSMLVRVLKINHDLVVSREATIGRANKKLGETDLYAYKHTKELKEEYFIVENKYLENFSNQYQQLLGYLNKNFRFGITISINKEKPFHEAVEYVRNRLLVQQSEDTLVNIKFISDPLYDHHGLIISTHIVPEAPDRVMDIYHLILNLYDPERKESALAARKKKKR